MALVIIEGSDGSGKSTLIERARSECKRYFWAARPSRRPDSCDALYDAATWIEASRLHDVTLVLDRHPYISEPIYGQILRGKSLIPPGSRTAMIRELIKEADRFIYCRPPRSVITDNVTASSARQLAGVLTKHLDIVDAYDQSMREILRLGGKVLWYDYTFDKRPLEDLLFGNPDKEQGNG